MNQFMKVAIDEAYQGIRQGHGGPFGAVVVKDGKIIGRGHNTVLKDSDVTCHGEIVAIKNACANLNSYNLKDCDIYTTFQPCLMCLGAIFWSNINHIYYGCTAHETSEVNFRDEMFYRDLDVNIDEKLKNRMSQIDHDACLKLFEEYINDQHKVIY